MKFIAGFADNYLDELMGVINMVHSAISFGRVLPAASGLIGAPAEKARTAPKALLLRRHLPLALCRFEPGVLTLRDEKAVLLELTPDRLAFLTGFLTQLCGSDTGIDGKDLNDFARHLSQEKASTVNIAARLEPGRHFLRVSFEFSAPGVSRRETHIFSLGSNL
jgi:hypothetical protein